MITLHNICKSYRTRGRRRVVLDKLSHQFQPGAKVGILGRNGAGKSTLIRLIGGEDRPDSGRILRESRVSWPIGFGGCFHGRLTGRENLRFVSRIYGRPIQRVTEFVEDFAELGDYLDLPVNTYSSGMKAKLSFGLSMALEFNFYLVDEVTAVGDAAFQNKCRAVLDQRRAEAGLILVSHSLGTIKRYCDEALVLDEGILRPFESIDQAGAFYERQCLSPVGCRPAAGAQ